MKTNDDLQPINTPPTLSTYSIMLSLRLHKYKRVTQINTLD